MDKLLKILAKDARLTNAQLAAMLNTTEADVAERIATLEKAGVIRGYQALVDWDKTDRELVTAEINLKIAPSKETGFDGIAEIIMSFDEVESVSLMSGGYDLSVIITGRSFKDVAMFVAKRLSPLDGVLSTATHFVLKRYKERGVLFTNEEKDERGQV
ncbi:MAG: Lrp/AsnC family transcriptional regulator [Clostridia bacterium]|nr:Lrp/AsnC family transcriptional regulator [Clostridia bacterium]